MKALGLIEVYGYLAAVEALDSALKAANVHLVDVTRVGGGLVTVMVTGDVGAVKAAMDASGAAAARVGTLVSIHVIPRPAEDVSQMLQTGTAESETVAEIADEIEKEPIEEDNKTKTISKPSEEMHITEQEMKEMTVERLRNLAREIGIENMTRKEIRFAKKAELIQKINEFMKQR